MDRCTKSKCLNRHTCSACHASSVVGSSMFIGVTVGLISVPHPVRWD